ncbi:pseudouridylate synthase 1 homolog [Spea bombifrons]|uniref:pseudouridylate synthase 1 homolog n=1 Tax=Spea bombifrons TaxID=233779 RepID=UPI00234959CA|nr:pseudouridylate synthase 1 homolog [Spea bombifrons]
MDEDTPDQISDEKPVCETADNVDRSNSDNIIPRKKFAMLMAYCGRGYHGMQMNPNAPDYPTIEGTLVSALVKAGCVPESYSSKMNELKFQRCARTDKGVSAVGQLVSARLLTSCINPVEEINLHLPPEIRILGIKQVTKGFNSKSMCDARTYSYMLPTFALSGCAPFAPDSSFRLPREQFHHINRLLSFYNGTHKYHNFTVKKTAEDPSVWRTMFSVSCAEPFVHHGIEFARILFTGQSFMMHQIRKMIGMIIAVTRGIVPAEFLTQCVQTEKFSLPTAPGLGLVLEHTHFNIYNSRYAGDGFHEALTWEETLPAINAFREEKITPVILEGELEELSMCCWLDKLKHHSFLQLQRTS